jgi:hypothetical protein
MLLKNWDIMKDSEEELIEDRDQVNDYDWFRFFLLSICFVLFYYYFIWFCFLMFEYVSLCF